MSPAEVPEGAYILYLYVPYSPILTLALVTVSALIIFRVGARLFELVNPID